MRVSPAQLISALFSGERPTGLASPKTPWPSSAAGSSTNSLPSRTDHRALPRIRQDGARVNSLACRDRQDRGDGSASLDEHFLDLSAWIGQGDDGSACAHGDVVGIDDQGTDHDTQVRSPGEGEIAKRARVDSSAAALELVDNLHCPVLGSARHSPARKCCTDAVHGGETGAQACLFGAHQLVHCGKRLYIE